MRDFAAEPKREASSVTAIPGGGVRGVVDGHQVLAGSPALVRRELCVEHLDPKLESAVTRFSQAGRTPIVVAVDGVALAAAAFADGLRSDARDTLAALEKLGARFALLSGDHPEVVAQAAASLGVPFVHVEGGAGPERKLACVTELERRHGRVVMVGDGVNDAGALAAARVGFSVHGGAEASLGAADVFATEPGLSPLLRAVVGARRTLRVIRRGIAFSLAYNAVGATLAVLGLLSPLLAAVAMPLSSLAVVTNAFRSRTFDAP